MSGSLAGPFNSIYWRGKEGARGRGPECGLVSPGCAAGRAMRTCINGATTMPYSLEEDIRAAGKAGFEGIEIWTGKLESYLKKHSTRELRELLEENNLKPASICPFFLVAFGDAGEALAKLEWGARVASEIGCPVLLVCPDAPKEGMGHAEAVEIAGNAARKYAEMGKSYGVKLALEPLGMHPFLPGPGEALEVIAAAGHDHLGLMMDTFHYYKSGVRVEDVGSIPVEKLLILHVNDCEDLPRNELTDGHRLYPGLGVIPLKESLRILKDRGYTGFLSVEIFRKAYWERPIEEIMSRSFQSLQNLLRSL